MKLMLRPLIIIIYAILMLYAVTLGITKPFCNWDMLGYIGTVVSWSAPSPEAIYEQTLTTVREHVPAWIVKQYLANPLSATSSAFVEQLPLYKMKPLYTGLMWLFHQAGMALPTASWAVSSLSILILAVMLFCWRPRYQNHSVWLVNVLFLSYLFPYAMGTLAQSSSPDALCTLLVAAMFFSWMHKGSFRWFAACTILAQLARPDALIMSVAFTFFFALVPIRGKLISKTQAILLCTTLAVGYVAVSKFMGNYGLERWFIYAFIHKTPYISQDTSHLTLASYWHTLYPSIILFVSRPRTILMLVWSVLSTLLYRMKPAEENWKNCAILWLSWLCLAVRFLLFPGWGEDRYYFVYFVIMLYTGGELMAPYAKGVITLLREANRKITQTTP